ncbi:phosphatase PAP2 family protein [Bacillus horti]|uniref:Undecaprenyl-diphosphatase n=1 Tax=Caldalkalibacillus horti TaxID=77523 RepID=A0ABT9W3U7_9BACI|nr:phosphatase PAP2 family protein [Bacillus horti]MDQ0167911.1 undecaprenyl-diphosphatase [Bacillus horti]
MPLEKQLSKAFLISLAGLIGFIGTSFLIRMEHVVQFDLSVLSAISKLVNPLLTSIMLFFSFIGNPSSVVVLTILIMFFLYVILRHRRELILLATVMLGTSILNILLKLIFQRVRPEINILIEQTGYSFPSGHSMGAFSLYAILTFILWRHVPSKLGRFFLILFSTCMIITIGISRLYLGVHYPSDVIGAYFISGFWVFLAIWFFQSWEERKGIQKETK